ncbi:MAG TPA: peptidoglycan-binding protein [Candidatus Bathyarchaeia archaeon]|nr:peptidoglycan-binding protein [Candidatus Bathyarchaeia archaeon]
MIKGLFKFLIIISAVVWFFVGMSNYMKKADSVRRLEKIERETIGSTQQENPRVKDVQRTLGALNYYSGVIDGIMGKQTRSAVMSFQRKNGLPETGRVDRKTLAQLHKQDLAGRKRDEKRHVLDKSSRRKRTDKVVQEQGSMETMSKNRSKSGNDQKSVERIREIQTALKAAGFYQGKVDGKLGQGTRRAIKEFQLSKNLKADGVVGRKTWGELTQFLNE